MKRSVVFLVAVATVLAVVVAGCTQAAPSPTPAASAPTSAPAAAPTSAPAKKVDFPEKGKAITLIVPFSAGGASDVSARTLAPYLEKELGVPIAVVNKAAGMTQQANTDLATAKPDGYTIGIIDIPSVNVTYLMPERGAVYTQKSFIPLWMYEYRSPGWAVKTDSPFKTLKDMIDAAKAKPDTIKVGDSGLHNPWHLATLAASKAAGISVVSVHFDGGGANTTALLGGHIDVSTQSLYNAASAIKNGQMRMLAIMSGERDKYLPDIPTFKELGYNVTFQTWYPVCVPAGTPKEVTDILTSALKKAGTNPDFVKKAEQNQATLAPPMTQAEIEKLWSDYDATVKPFLEMAK